MKIYRDVTIGVFVALLVFNSARLFNIPSLVYLIMFVFSIVGIAMGIFWNKIFKMKVAKDAVYLRCPKCKQETFKMTTVESLPVVVCVHCQGVFECYEDAGKRFIIMEKL